MVKRGEDLEHVIFELEEYITYLETASFESNFKAHLDYQRRFMQGPFIGDVDTMRRRSDPLSIESTAHEEHIELLSETLVHVTGAVIHALIDEAREVHNEVPWKFWKADYGTGYVKLTAIREEIVDLQHFVNVLVMLWFDGDVQAFNETFARKLRENVRRQEEGY